MISTPDLITVVIPVHDRADILTRTLDSIAAQRYRPLSLIIVDNASSDSSCEVAEKWADANRSGSLSVTLLSESRPGASAARNTGLVAVRSEYVMFFDSDDTMEPDHLERIAAILSRRPDIDLLHWGVACRTPDGWTTMKDSSNSSDILSEHLLHTTLSTIRYVVRTSFIRSVGGWNERLSTWDDYELGVRLLLAHPSILHLPGPPRVYALQWEDSLTGPDFSSRMANHRKVFAALQSLIGNEPTRHNLILASRKVIIAALYIREGTRAFGYRLLSDTLAPYSRKNRMKLRLIHTFQLIAGRGGSSLAALLFPAPVRHD